MSKTDTATKLQEIEEQIFGRQGIPENADEHEKNVIQHFEKLDEVDGGTWSSASESAHTYLRKNNKEALFNHLRSVKVSTIRVEFDGSGDSGQINSVDFYGAKNKAVKLNSKETVKGYVAHGGTCYHPSEDNKPSRRTHRWNLKLSLNDAVEDFCYSVLEQHHSGWEINGGSFGSFEFTVGKKDLTCELDMNERVEEIISNTENY